MADLTNKKSDTLTRLVDIIPRAMKLAADIKELKSYATDNGFLAGGANAITDADCVDASSANGGGNSHLTAAIFNDAVGTIDTLTLSQPNATKLRLASKTPIPGNT